MTLRQASERDLRVLVLAPFGRDGELTCGLLEDAGIDAVQCEDVAHLCDTLWLGAGAAIVATEALDRAGLSLLAATLGEQAAWSDIPLVLATTGSRMRDAREWTLRALEPAGHITLLERPIRIQTLISVVKSALITRRRQYEMRDLIEQLRLGVDHLDAERVVRERFVDLLAHDLRGPLGASRMSAEMLIARSLSPDQVRALAVRIEKCVDRAELMIRNLLDANRLRAGHRLPLELRRCDLMAIAYEAIEDVGAADRTRILVQGPERLEGCWDADLLRRALWNLVTNAIKYGAPDTPVEVTLRRTEDSAWVRVHNWGPGIPAEEQRRLFEPFTRASGAEAGAQRGWGLGLTLVRGVATSHGGMLELSSDPESGTSFSLQVPLDARPFEPVAADA